MVKPNGREIPQNASSGQPDAFEAGSGIRVLVVEDNPANQLVAARMLEKLGCSVDVASTGLEALQMTVQFSYSLIFMDCQMPEMDGLTATRMIRQRQDASAAVPILAMTAMVLAEDREECRRAGMNDFVGKPISLLLLRDAIEKWSVRGRGIARCAGIGS